MAVQKIGGSKVYYPPPDLPRMSKGQQKSREYETMEPSLMLT